MNSMPVASAQTTQRPHPVCLRVWSCHRDSFIVTHSVPSPIPPTSPEHRAVLLAALSGPPNQLVSVCSPATTCVTVCRPASACVCLCWELGFSAISIISSSSNRSSRVVRAEKKKKKEQNE
ncbi:hypothetical protein quinque_006417 [Culex quinquefasciatus]